MIRKIILALVVLAVVVVPVPTLARGGGGGGQGFHDGGGQGFHGGHELRDGHERRHERFRHGFDGFDTPYSDDTYAPDSCYWQEGYWGPNQPYIDEYGFERFEPVWVPGQSVCS